MSKSSQPTTERAEQPGRDRAQYPALGPLGGFSVPVLPPEGLPPVLPPWGLPPVGLDEDGCVATVGAEAAALAEAEAVVLEAPAAGGSAGGVAGAVAVVVVVVGFGGAAAVASGFRVAMTAAITIPANAAAPSATITPSFRLGAGCPPYGWCVTLNCDAYEGCDPLPNAGWLLAPNEGCDEAPNEGWLPAPTDGCEVLPKDGWLLAPNEGCEIAPAECGGGGGACGNAPLVECCCAWTPLGGIGWLPEKLCPANEGWLPAPTEGCEAWKDGWDAGCGCDLEPGFDVGAGGARAPGGSAIVRNPSVLPGVTGSANAPPVEGARRAMMNPSSAVLNSSADWYR